MSMKQWDLVTQRARRLTRYRTTLVVPATDEGRLVGIADALECQILDQMPPAHRLIRPAAWYATTLTMRHTYRGVEWELSVDIEERVALPSAPPERTP